MPKIQTIKNSFMAGEFDPELEGRSDLEKFNASAKELTNVVVMKQGGVTIRPPMVFLGPSGGSDINDARVVPFVFSRTDAYALEFSGSKVRVWKNRQRIETSPGVAYDIPSLVSVNEIADFDYASSGDTMIIVHSTLPPQRLRRFADNYWVMDTTPLHPGPIAEVGRHDGTTLTISNVALGAGRTVTASGNTFLASDVGRRLEWFGGIAVITAVATPTSATATVEQAFLQVGALPNEWTMTDSPITQNTPSAAGPVGATITMTLLAAGWRNTDVGNGWVEINGGLVEITGFTSSTVVDGIIRRELQSAVAAPADAWVLKSAIFNGADGFPRTVSFHSQRLWFGGTRRFPQSVWGSRSGLPFDFTPGTVDDDAVYKTADSDDFSPLMYLVSQKTLVMLGYGCEWEGKGGIEKPITQTNMQINEQGQWGCDAVRPVACGKESLFVERGRTALRVLAPNEVEGYDSGEVSIYSAHLLVDGIRSMTYERKPNAVVWIVTQEGELRAFTYNREQNTAAMARAETVGEVRWVCTVPEGSRDITYMTVRREIDGTTYMNVECFDWTVGTGKFDMRGSQSDTPAKATWDGLDDWEGLTLGVYADDVYMGTFTVAGGEITLPRPALAISYGIPYTARVVDRAPEVSTGSGTSQGQAMSTNKVKVRLHQSIGLKVNGKAVEFRRLGSGVLDAPVPPFSGLKTVTDYGWVDGESDLVLEQDQGAPWTVLAVIRDFTVNSG